MKRNDFESLKIKARKNETIRNFLDNEEKRDNPFFKGYKSKQFFNFEKGTDIK